MSLKNIVEIYRDIAISREIDWLSWENYKPHANLPRHSFSIGIFEDYSEAVKARESYELGQEIDGSILVDHLPQIFPFPKEDGGYVFELKAAAVAAWRVKNIPYKIWQNKILSSKSVADIWAKSDGMKKNADGEKRLSDWIWENRPSEMCDYENHPISTISCDEYSKIVCS